LGRGEESETFVAYSSIQNGVLWCFVWFYGAQFQFQWESCPFNISCILFRWWDLLLDLNNTIPVDLAAKMKARKSYHLDRKYEEVIGVIL
jgi:hypothetical protein